MNDISTRIKQSHNDAAQRAIDLMKDKTNFTLHRNLANELVAVILGQPNWNTLQALAAQGRGPRIDTDMQVEAPSDGDVSEAVETNVNTACQAAHRLEEFFGRRWSGQHPSYARSDWNLKVVNEEVRDDYWPYVVCEIQKRGDVLPWEVSAERAKKVVKKVGYRTQFQMSPQPTWAVFEKDGVMSHSEGYLTEEDAYVSVFIALTGAASKNTGRPIGELMQMSDEVLCSFMKTYFDEHVLDFYA